MILHFILNKIVKTFKLGIFMNQEKLVNHRSLIKIIFNPIFRLFGFNILTIVNYSLNKHNEGYDYYTLEIKSTHYKIGKFKPTEKVKPLKWDFLGKNMNKYNIWISIIKINKINYNIDKGKINATIS